MQDMLGSVHESFKDVVRNSRKDRLKGPEDDLFSGRAWTGRQVRCRARRRTVRHRTSRVCMTTLLWAQAVGLGLIDGVSDMQARQQRLNAAVKMATRTTPSSEATVASYKHAGAGCVGERAECQGPHADRVSGRTLQSGALNLLLALRNVVDSTNTVPPAISRRTRQRSIAKLSLTYVQVDGIFGGVRSALTGTHSGRSYDFCRDLTAAALDEVHEKSLWARYGL